MYTSNEFNSFFMNSVHFSFQLKRILLSSESVGSISRENATLLLANIDEHGAFGKLSINLVGNYRVH